MKQIFLATLFVGTTIMTSAHGESFSQHVLVVLDNSATVQDESGNGRLYRPNFMIARTELVKKIADEYSDDTLVTLLSVSRSQVIWQGSAGEITHRKNFVLAEYLGESIDGCADFMSVAATIQRELKYAEIPLSDLIIFSSLVHTGGRESAEATCAVDRDHLQPPDEFFDAIVAIQTKTKATVSFYWAFDEVAPLISDYFDDNNIRVYVYQEKRSLAELGQ